MIVRVAFAEGQITLADCQWQRGCYGGPGAADQFRAKKPDRLLLDRVTVTFQWAVRDDLASAPPRLVRSPPDAQSSTDIFSALKLLRPFCRKAVSRLRVRDRPVLKFVSAMFLIQLRHVLHVVGFA